jgi:hypothetical protein
MYKLDTTWSTVKHIYFFSRASVSVEDAVKVQSRS